MLNNDGTYALEATGALNLSGGDFVNVSAEEVAVRVNTTSTDYSATPQTIAIDDVSTTLSAAAGVQEVTAKGLSASGGFPGVLV